MPCLARCLRPPWRPRCAGCAGRSVQRADPRTHRPFDASAPHGPASLLRSARPFLHHLFRLFCALRLPQWPRLRVVHRMFDVCGSVSCPHCSVVPPESDAYHVATSGTTAWQPSARVPILDASWTAPCCMSVRAAVSLELHPHLIPAANGACRRGHAARLGAPHEEPPCTLLAAPWRARVLYLCWHCGG